MTCVAEFVLPHIFRRILLHFREKFLLNNSKKNSFFRRILLLCTFLSHFFLDLDQNFAGVEKLIDFLQINSDYGAAMKQTICTILLDKDIYRKLFYGKNKIFYKYSRSENLRFLDKTTTASIAKVLFESQLCYEHALKSLESICTKEEAEILGQCVIFKNAHRSNGGRTF